MNRPKSHETLFENNHARPTSYPYTTAPWVACWIIFLGLGVIFPGRASAQSTVAGITAATAVGVDLEVAMIWGEGSSVYPSAELVLEESSGLQVATLSVTPNPQASTTHLLVGVFDNVFTHGFQYRLRVLDPQGQDLTTALDFRLELICNQNQCFYRTQGPLYSDGLVVSQRLLEQIQQTPGTSDLLNEILAANPDLLGDLHTFAWQLDRTDSQSPIGGSCHCFWTSAAQHLPDSQSTTRLATASTQEVERVGAGASFGLAAETTRGSADPIATGTSQLTMDLVCILVTGWSVHTVSPAPGVTEEIRWPTAKKCTAHCTSQRINFEATVHGHLAYETSRGARVRIQQYADLFVGASEYAFEVSEADASRESSYAVDHYSSVLNHSVPQQRASASIEVGGEVFVHTEEATGYAFGLSILDSGIRAEGVATCNGDVIQNITEVTTISFTESEGGVLIERWGPGG